MHRFGSFFDAVQANGFRMRLVVLNLAQNNFRLRIGRFVVVDGLRNVVFDGFMFGHRQSKSLLVFLDLVFLKRSRY